MSFTQLTTSTWRRGVRRSQRRYTFEFGICMPKHILGTVSKVMMPQIIWLVILQGVDFTFWSDVKSGSTPELRSYEQQWDLASVYVLCPA